MIYFTSDLHFGHKNILRYDNRPFATVEEMDAELIERWNKKVTPKDIVYVLGDIGWYTSDRLGKIIEKLNGHKILIVGNHDKGVLGPTAALCFDSIHSYLEIKVDGRLVVLSHFPILFYNHQHHGGYMLYGHVHNSAEWNMVENYKKEIQRLGIPCNLYNVGCMLWNYEPVSLDEIISDPRFQPAATEGVDD